MARTKIDKALLDLSGVLPLTGGTLTGNLTFNPSTDGIVGTATNNNAPAGDWDVSGMVQNFTCLDPAVVKPTWDDKATGCPPLLLAAGYGPHRDYPIWCRRS